LLRPGRASFPGRGVGFRPGAATTFFSSETHNQKGPHPMKSRRSLFTVLCSLFTVLCALLTVAADPVKPAACPLILYRDAAATGTYLSTVNYYQGDYITFSNSVMYSTADLGTNSVPQNLSNCVITVTLGSETVTASTTGTIINASAGTWNAALIVPEVAPSCFIEVTISNTWNYTYRREMIRTQPHLGE
jgi:hypothetical protein